MPENNQHNEASQKHQEAHQKHNEAYQRVGQIQIANEVIMVIAGTAALEVEGVAGTAGNLKGDLAEMLGKKNLAKGVSVTIENSEASFELSIIVKIGYKIQEVGAAVQKRVKNAVETMTGLTVSEVNVTVNSVQMEKAAKVSN